MLIGPALLGKKSRIPSLPPRAFNVQTADVVLSIFYTSPHTHQHHTSVLDAPQRSFPTFFNYQIVDHNWLVQLPSSLFPAWSRLPSTFVQHSFPALKMLPLDFSDSSVIVLSPYQHQFDPISRAAHSLTSLNYQSTKPIMPSRSWDNSINTNTPSTARKRGREPENPLDNIPSYLPPSRTPNISPHDIHGQGMALIDPMTENVTDAATSGASLLQDRLNAVSQSQQVEESIETPQMPKEMPDSKRVRSSMSTSVRDFAGTLEAGNGSAIETGDDEVDQYSEMLGIGWSKVSDDPDVLAAARGCARYIEKHYPLSNVEVKAKNTSNDMGLVKASGGWFLLPVDLSKCRLIGRDWEHAMGNLKQNPIAFEEAEEMLAAESPITGQGNGTNMASDMVSESMASQMDMD